MKKFFKSLVFRMLIGVILGIGIGLAASEPLIGIINTIKSLLSQIIFFSIPLIIIAFIAPSVAGLRANASRLLTVSVILAYASSVGAAAMSMTAGYLLIPHLSVRSVAESLKKIPDLVFELNIPAIMPVMSALLLAIIIGVSAAWTKADLTQRLLEEFRDMVLETVNRIIIPMLPVFIAATFAVLTYEGSITKQLPVFISVILIVMAGHFIWLALLYIIAGIYTGEKPSDVYQHFGAAYLTAVGTMSSAATLPVTLSCARKSRVLKSDIIDFGIPLFSNIHLCGSVLTEVFFVMVVARILYGKLPSLPSMLLFILLLGVFAIGAPGVPGGTVMASLGIIISVLGFNESGTALMLTIFALQDSFGTACNVTGDGALTLIINGYSKKLEEKRRQREQGI